ncbi:putative fimbrial-like adhesin protein [Escherichia coli]|nr:putative fimbrial-like adhesin protein [Escherichia coli]SQN98780.1 putative fimbrial-like adhesin protein [Escherichia coli]SQO01315.1 putative fimbrial-like adhesin protein [Escherichia coli]
MMSLWDALRMNMMISYQELVRTFPVTPATGSATQFSCVTPASQEVTISTAANAVVYYPMSARLVVEKNKTVNNVTAGKFSAPATFTVTYN